MIQRLVHPFFAFRILLSISLFNESLQHLFNGGHQIAGQDVLIAHDGDQRCWLECVGRRRRRWPGRHGGHADRWLRIDWWLAIDWWL
ncbi:MAG: hypothetical protein KDA47_07670, partial [Planctomycetales bacterium]|nr:hypothetical protein [Planctomycetales bacterium]